MYHAYSRGNRRATIFFDDADYATFLRHFESVVERFEWMCHGFCLMPNHYHLLLETPEPNLARGMHVLNLAYARHLNWRYARSGHVFQGPYRSSLVRREPHLIELCRYIALNPVRAGLVAHPADWRWTSYRATAGLEPAPPYLTTARVLGFFPSVDAFRAFVVAPITVLGLAA